MRVFIFSLILVTVLFIMVESNCFESWCRCTSEIEISNNFPWLTCLEYCRKCKNRAKGKCIDSVNKECSGEYTCL